MNIDPNQLKLLKDLIPEETLKNLLNPSTVVVGKGLAGILYYVFQKPLEFGIVEKKHLDSLSKMTSNDLSKIPSQNRDEKGMGLAFKTIEESKYSLGDEELRKWFSQLIASSVDDRKNNSLTPYYSTVLSNLNSDAANFLLDLVKFGNEMSLFPFCYIQKKVENGFIELQNNIINFNWTDENQPLIMTIDPNTIEVLKSFNIISVDYQSSLTSKKAKDAYKDIETSDIFRNQALLNAIMYHKCNSNYTCEEYKEIPFHEEVQLKQGLLKITSFGESFIKVSMPD
ncbi:hypothetical protein AKUH3B111A_14100 [Apilactobacillus kunkeei]|uniref:Abi-alpha family protein n=1 Tax=Apilactobacillus kunkeei TaxID=148814 RepID=UPI00112C2593|nr:Abi-alpha family protein [Apilactobacillus kunkeei]TPR54973.1 DUF4393 domain-containing protein [Apilactobacillus kunkeei]CAI2663719.1 hypothetical protein AKUH3B103M_14130 [Apilactobacillus kunkeei]CAI2663727.1 hypothetical protein AKUH4B204J_14270 [Apilactobacillus kunkeei]CAI2664857.1 hypothetical protein AKUH3B104X_14130 [Apilactobacillus kunkeei]CAI2665400.1 hypothetical protein AKUH3B111A_14100 [Apilactobacillus kunkeei]